MPSCKNGTGSYKGTEPSPKGRGFCARYEKIGTKKKGKNKKMWAVRSVKLSSGKRSKRWFKVLPKAKNASKTKKTTKPTKRKAGTSSTKKKTTKHKKLQGGDWESDQVAVLKKLRPYRNAQMNGKSVESVIMELYNVIQNYAMVVVLPKKLNIDISKFQEKVQETQKEYESTMGTFKQNLERSQLSEWQKHDIIDNILPEFEDDITDELNAEISMSGQDAQALYDSRFSKSFKYPWEK